MRGPRRKPAHRQHRDRPGQTARQGPPALVLHVPFLVSSVRRLIGHCVHRFICRNGCEVTPDNSYVAWFGVWLELKRVDTGGPKARGESAWQG
ncbi:predicted protein [Streptomyces viridochromogenes DSM 40736]|uniref:Predicted protein n=1 Tax=Streptomyces viridochromogenes (strain DSM 40736 / JCM 4977 / BCRC 1201 / Tue 494) TaxID=591159 RepID=D9X0P6_STRVT|nr:predicted protein [Streptomyces viridochromogenes DSM 40736]